MIQLSDDSGGRATECRSGQRTGLSTYNTAFTLTLSGCLKWYIWYSICTKKKKKSTILFWWYTPISVLDFD